MLATSKTGSVFLKGEHSIPFLVREPLFGQMPQGFSDSGGGQQPNRPPKDIILGETKNIEELTPQPIIKEGELSDLLLPVEGLSPLEGVVCQDSIGSIKTGRVPLSLTRTASTSFPSTHSISLSYLFLPSAGKTAETQKHQFIQSPQHKSQLYLYFFAGLLKYSGYRYYPAFAYFADVEYTADYGASVNIEAALYNTDSGFNPYFVLYSPTPSKADYKYIVYQNKTADYTPKTLEIKIPCLVENNNLLLFYDTFIVQAVQLPVYGSALQQSGQQTGNADTPNNHAEGNYTQNTQNLDTQNLEIKVSHLTPAGFDEPIIETGKYAPRTFVYNANYTVENNSLLLLHDTFIFQAVQLPATPMHHQFGGNAPARHNFAGEFILPVYDNALQQSGQQTGQQTGNADTPNNHAEGNYTQNTQNLDTQNLEIKVSHLTPAGFDEPNVRDSFYSNIEDREAYQYNGQYNGASQQFTNIANLTIRLIKDRHLRYGNHENPPKWIFRTLSNEVAGVPEKHAFLSMPKTAYLQPKGLSFAVFVYNQSGLEQELEMADEYAEEHKNKGKSRNYKEKAKHKQYGQHGEKNPESETGEDSEASSKNSPGYFGVGLLALGGLLLAPAALIGKMFDRDNNKSEVSEGPSPFYESNAQDIDAKAETYTDAKGDLKPEADKDIPAIVLGNRKVDAAYLQAYNEQYPDKKLRADYYDNKLGKRVVGWNFDADTVFGYAVHVLAKELGEEVEVTRGYTDWNTKQWVDAFIIEPRHYDKRKKGGYIVKINGKEPEWEYGEDNPLLRGEHSRLEEGIEIEIVEVLNQGGYFDKNANTHIEKYQAHRRIIDDSIMGYQSIGDIFNEKTKAAEQELRERLGENYETAVFITNDVCVSCEMEDIGLDTKMEDIMKGFQAREMELVYKTRRPCNGQFYDLFHDRQRKLDDVKINGEKYYGIAKASEFSAEQGYTEYTEERGSYSVRMWDNQNSRFLEEKHEIRHDSIVAYIDRHAASSGITPLFVKDENGINGIRLDGIAEYVFDAKRRFGSKNTDLYVLVNGEKAADRSTNLGEVQFEPGDKVELMYADKKRFDFKEYQNRSSSYQNNAFVNLYGGGAGINAMGDGKQAVQNY